MLRTWSLAIRLEPETSAPIYLQIARAIASQIEHGVLTPGSALPGTRELAKMLGIHRNTVTAAYDELVAQGRVESEASRGTFVSQSLNPPSLNQSTRSSPTSPEVRREDFLTTRRQAAEGSSGKDIIFTDGTADARRAPICELSRAYRRALAHQTVQGWSYTDPRGIPVLRGLIAEMLRVRRAIPSSSEQVFVTRGSQMAIYLAGQAILSPGSLMVVEQPGYRYAWEAFQRTGAEVIGVPVDEHGLNVDCLERISSERHVTAVYTTPHHQYPTTITLTAERRAQLLQWAERTGAIIIEDDYDHEFHYEGPPILPLASQDLCGCVIYIGTFSKLFAPGLRIGYLRASEELIQPMVRIRSFIDRQGDSVLEAAIAELIRDGDLRRHTRRAREEYRRRRDAFAALLTEEFGERLQIQLPRGGMSLWLKPDATVDTEEWSAVAKSNGVFFAPSSEYSLHGFKFGGVRMGFASLSIEELARAAKILRSSLPQAQLD